MRRIRFFLKTIFSVVVTLPFALLPLGIALRVGRCLGSVVFVLWGSRRRIAVENIRSAIERGSLKTDSDPEVLIKENFRNLGMSLVEVIKIYYGLGGKIIDSVEVVGLENFEKANQRRAGTIFITGHCGNWELLALVCSRRLASMNVIARPMNNPYLHWLVERVREKYGNRMIYKKGALKKILAALKRNEIIGILIDQSVVEEEGIEAMFLGKQDFIVKTPAIIALKTGCAVLPAFIRRAGKSHIVEVGPEIQLERAEDYEKEVYVNSVVFSRSIEDYIRTNPAEWLWMHRRWKRSRQPFNS